MTVKRIVSFLPSATELLYELGVQDRLFGVTHECTYPKDASLKPRVVDTVIDSNTLTSKEIDTMTSKLQSDGKDIFVLDEDNLRDANPDLIILQETCDVCAAHADQAHKAMQILKTSPTLHFMNPHNMREIIDSVTKLGELLEKKHRAKEITDSLEQRITNLKRNTPARHPKVIALEWLEPFFTAGHWVPEMVQIAGGTNMSSNAGERSRRLGISDVASSDPDIIILMPCGFDIQRTVSEYDLILKADKRWNSLRAVRDNMVFAVDAGSFFSKPSIRTIDGIEILAKIIRPEQFADFKVPENSSVHIST